MAAAQNVVHPDDVEPRLAGNVEARVTFEASSGSGRLEQRVVRFGPGRAGPQRLADQQAVIYVVAGGGVLELEGNRYELEPGTAAYVAAGEMYAIDVPDALELVNVLVPAATEPSPASRKVTVRFEDQPELEASEERTYRYLVNEEAGCEDVTQFLGIVQPSKAPFHSHPYDEVGYVVSGRGVAHIDGEETPLRAGSCFHLAPGQIHCIENSGPGEMRILGVFHPSGSPANRSYQDNK
jgi:quercetin dioxygenase-like cupin family protein